MCEVIRLKGPCQAGATRLNESRERGAIGQEAFIVCRRRLRSLIRQAGATRLNESRERGAIDVAEFFFLHQAIAESSTDPKSGDRYV